MSKKATTFTKELAELTAHGIIGGEPVIAEGLYALASQYLAYVQSRRRGGSSRSDAKLAAAKKNIEKAKLVVDSRSSSE